MSSAADDEPVEVQQLRMQLKNVELDRDFAVAQAKQLKTRNAALTSKVRTLERERDRATIEAQDLRWQKMHAEADRSLQASIHRDEKQEWGRKVSAMQDKMSKQASKAAKLITSLIHPSSRSSSRRVSQSGAAALPDQAAGLPTAPTATPIEPAFVAQLGSDSEEVQQQVQQLLLGYMSGSVSEADALQQLSSLSCTLSIAAADFAAERVDSDACAGGGAAAADDGAPTGDAPTAAPAGAPSAPSQAATASAPATAATAAASTASTSTPGMHQMGYAGAPVSAPGWAHYTSFVLAEPEKLQRLIARANSLGGAPGNTAAGAPAAGGSALGATANAAAGAAGTGGATGLSAVHSPSVMGKSQSARVSHSSASGRVSASGSEGGAGDGEVVVHLPAAGHGLNTTSASKTTSFGAGDEKSEKGGSSGSEKIEKSGSGKWKAVDRVSSWGSKLVSSWASVPTVSTAPATKPTIASGPGLPKARSSSTSSSTAVSVAGAEPSRPAASLPPLRSDSGSVTFGGSNRRVSGSGAGAAAAGDALHAHGMGSTLSTVAAAFAPSGKNQDVGGGMSPGGLGAHALPARGLETGMGMAMKEGPDFVSSSREVTLFGK